MKVTSISREQFNEAKKHLLEASKQRPEEVVLKEFQRDAGLIGLLNHKVTGGEVNTNLVLPLQKTIQEQNKCIGNLFDIADEVYNTINVLDNEYIAGIRGTAEAAAIASNHAKRASDQAKNASSEALSASQAAKKASDKANQAQEDNKRTIQALQQTVALLRKFKDEVDNINHLSDVDTIWQAVENHKSNLLTLKSQVDVFVAETTDFIQRINKCVVELQGYRVKLESYVHLADIDTLWQNVEDHKASLIDLHKQVDDHVAKMSESILSIKNEVTMLQEYRAKLESCLHLTDIDTIWQEVDDYKANLADLHCQVDGFVKEVKDAESVMNNDIKDLEQKHNQVSKSVKVAYGIAGSSLVLTIIQLALQLMGVL